jgi:hypothetical protein
MSCVNDGCSFTFRHEQILQCVWYLKLSAEIIMGIPLWEIWCYIVNISEMLHTPVLKKKLPWFFISFGSTSDKIHSYLIQLYTNLLSLNFDKTHIIHFKTKNTQITEVSVKYNDKLIYSLNNIKFLGIFINDTLTWSSHLDQLTNKLSSACYAVRVMKQYMRLKTLIMIYYAYFHSLMNYGLIFWGNSLYCIHVFRLQKKVIRIITSTRNRESCRSWFKRLKILPLQLQYIYDCNNFTNTCTIHLFITYTCLHVSASPGHHQGVTLPKVID